MVVEKVVKSEHILAELMAFSMVDMWVENLALCLDIWMDANLDFY